MSSIQPRKQRKYRAQAPLHARRKMMHVHISKELRAKLGIKKRSTLLHKGDKVRLRIGDNAGKSGTVMDADYTDLKVYVEGIATKKARGTEKLIAISPSNLEIIEGDFTQKDRARILARWKKK
jgi:large subunit ribosomal protein L24